MDLSYKDDMYVVSNPLEDIIQQIDMLFDTEESEILNDIDYGTGYDIFIHELKYNTTQIRDIIYNDLSENVDFGEYSFDVEVNIIEGTIEDIILVNIKIYNESEITEKTYQI